MAKILIIGSAGFIGSNLLRAWAPLHQVWGADILAQAPHQQYMRLDAQSPDFQQLIQTKNFDLCINCSGAAQVGQSFDNPARDFQLNTNNVFAILEAIRLHNPSCKFINLSSAAVYGNPPSIPVLEDMPSRPLSPYGYHKKMAEDICASFATNFGLQTCTLRIFSAYGEGLRKQLFWDIAQKAAANPDGLSLWGTGQETRDFIYIKDLIAVFDCVRAAADFKGECINVASGIEITIKEAAQTLLAALDYKGDLSFTQQQKIGDPTRWQADISQLQVMGFKPKYSLADGLENYAKWIQNQNNA